MYIQNSIRNLIKFIYFSFFYLIDKSISLQYKIQLLSNKVHTRTESSNLEFNIKKTDNYKITDRNFKNYLAYKEIYLFLKYNE